MTLWSIERSICHARKLFGVRRETNLLEFMVFKDGMALGGLRKHTHAEIMTAFVYCDDAQLRLHDISGGKRKAADAFAE